MSRKGISPLIAAVLLIAFTMAVASIFAQWAPQLMQDAQGDTKERAETIQDCSDRTIDVRSGDNGGNVTVQQTGGDDGIGNLTVTFFYESSDPAQNNTDAGNDIENPRGLTTIENPNPGNTVTRVEVDPTDCEGAASAELNP